ncbi:MAG: isocitrate/isopropylmalate dehydrogenase family protein [Thermodesulfobacteriota bacterium]
MRQYQIVVLPGDGIGPEITAAAIEILQEVQKISGGFELIFDYHEAGAGYYLKTGRAISEATLEAIGRAEATLKGPVGLPNVRKPDGTEAGLLGGVLRVGFDLYANIRPISLFPNVPAPLAGTGPGDIDYIILRENTQGLYLSRGVGLVTEDAATDTLLLTRRGCERICRLAFELARDKKNGAPEDGRRRVTLIDKSNVLRSFAFFREIFLEVAAQHPDLEAEGMYVDAGAAALVARPGHFHVIVTENLFGDILSDLGAATVGGLGLCPGANIGDRTAYFEPIHGSAPDIAGKGLANPVSQIRAAAMMLDYLGEKAAAALIEAAVLEAFSRKRIRINPGGSIPGGPPEVVKAVRDILPGRTSF